MERFLANARPGLLAVLLLLTAATASSQERRSPSEGGMVHSLGLPGRNLMHGGLTGGAYIRGDEIDFTAYGSIATYRDFIHPAYTIMGLWGELYGGIRREDKAVADGGVRAMILAPQFRVGAGVDYNFRDSKLDAIVSTMIPIRRGGFIGHGSMLRIDWLPDRDHSFNVGIEVALQRYSGETRPAKDHVTFSKPRSTRIAYQVADTTLEDALASVRDAAHWINRMTVPYLDHKGFKENNGLAQFESELQALKAHMASVGPLYPNGRTIHEEVRVYHDELDRAFSIAATGEDIGPGMSTELGREVSARAREILFEEVISRYDRLLGQRKKNDGILGLSVNARGILARWLNTESRVEGEGKDAVLYVFQRLIDIIEENRKWSKQKWEDSRLVWIPMQFALRPEQHDTQAELDRLIERTTEREFSDGNQVYYLINEKFQFEVSRMILRAEDYHVLWIHDFRGVDAAGDPDEVAFAQVVDSYFRAMTNRVRRYDETGKLPVYMIVQDQFYYENNKSRRWHELLMNPLEHSIDLPRDYSWMEARIDSAQKELRNAVAASHLLQAEAREYGEAWLKNRIKVHVTITQPADASFWSDYVMPILGIHDNYIRDHRKISFYDLTEDDPNKGAAVYTGMGIGEHYTGASWEDRGIIATGPAVLALKEACRELLTQNGFADDEIPHPLRARPKPADYDAMVAADPEKGKSARAMELHNVVGYGPKRISVFKAMVYTLMPPRAVLLMPDFVWQSPLWASMAVGGALRGTRSLIIYPSLENQPSPSALPQSRAREMFRRLVRVQQEFAGEFTASGGMLKTGFYDLDVDVKDLRGRIAKAVASYERYPFLLDLVHADPDTARWKANAEELEAALDREGYEIRHYVKDAKVRRPQLHMKAQFYASGEVWDSFFSHFSGQGELARAYILAWAHQLRDEEAEPTQFQEAMAPILETFRQSVIEKTPPEEIEKYIVYLSVGSQNMDYRGMFLDGEVVFVTSTGGVLTGVMDLLTVALSTDWVDDVNQIDQHMGSYGWFTRHLARWATPLM